MVSRKAWLRATREACGTSQQDLARRLGVRPLTVRRWEREDGPEPPEDVMGHLALALEAHDRAVAELVRSALEEARSTGAATLEVRREHGEDGPLSPQELNRIATDAAAELRRAGIPVEWRYPGEGQTPVVREHHRQGEAQ